MSSVPSACRTSATRHNPSSLCPPRRRPFTTAPRRLTPAPSLVGRICRYSIARPVLRATTVRNGASLVVAPPRAEGLSEASGSTNAKQHQGIEKLWNAHPARLRTACKLPTDVVAFHTLIVEDQWPNPNSAGSNFKSWRPFGPTGRPPCVRFKEASRKKNRPAYTPVQTKRLPPGSQKGCAPRQKGWELSHFGGRHHP